MNTSLVERINSQRNILLLALGVLILLTMGYAGYNSYKAKTNETAASALFEILEKTSQEKPAVLLQSKGDLLKEVESLAVKHKGTMASFEAWTKLGDIYFEGAQFDKAVQYYNNASQSAPHKQLKILSLYSKALSEESSSKYENAIDTLNSALRMGEKSLRAELLLSAARNYGLKGDKAKAKEQYELVEKDFINTDAAKQATRLKASL